MADKEIESRITPVDWLCNENKYRFRVPVYQRLFAWDTPQFDRLLSDLQDWDQNKPYYLGIITVVKQKHEHGDTYILIDGQQRLTVIAILMGIFKDDKFRMFPITNYLDYEARQNDRRALEKIWENGIGWLGCGTKDELIKKMDENQIVNDSMRSFIGHIWEKKSEWKKIIDKKIFNRLTLLISCLPENYEDGLELQNEYFEKMNSAGKQLEPHEILKVRICKREIDFEDWNLVEDFTKKYPKSLERSFQDKDGSNTNNQQSQQSEIASPEEGKNTNEYNKQPPLYSVKRIIEAYERRDSTTIAKNFPSWDKETSENISSVEKWRPSLIDFPMFLLHVLHVVNDKILLPSDSHSLLKKFEEHTFKNKKEFIEFIELMCKYRKFLDEWIIHKDVDSCEQKSKDDENNTDVSNYSYWSEKGMEKKYILSKEDIVSKELKQIQIALSTVGEQKQEWMIDAFIWYRKNEKNISRETLLDYHVLQLVRQLANDVRMKADYMRIFSEDCWADECLTYKHNSRALFVCLDYFLWLLANTDDETLKKDLYKDVKDVFNTIPSFQNDREAIVCFVPKAHKSVEHFHPQTEGDSQHETEWNEYINDNSNNQIKKDMFGNLALISAGRNSEYGNQTVAAKSERIEKLIQRKELESIKLYLMMQKCDKSEKNWTPDIAQCHSNEMLKVLKWGFKYYRRSAEEIE